MSLLQVVAKDVRTDGLCHGDMRLDNLLFGRDPQLVLVDWELSGLGATIWDVACLLANFVDFWAVGAMRPRNDPGGATTSAKRRLARFHVLLGAFWRAYQEFRSPRPAWIDRPELVAQMTAVRLIQTALEYSHQSIVPTRESVMLLSLAEEFAARPVENWVHILRLPLAEANGQIGVEWTSTPT